MKVVTTIVITQEVDKGFEEQVKRNFERTPVFGGTDVGIRKHLQRLIPALTDEDIHVDFSLQEPEYEIHQLRGESDEILGSWVVDSDKEAEVE